MSNTATNVEVTIRMKWA